MLWMYIYWLKTHHKWWEWLRAIGPWEPLRTDEWSDRMRWRPIRGQYPGHVITLNKSQAGIGIYGPMYQEHEMTNCAGSHAGQGRAGFQWHGDTAPRHIGDTSTRANIYNEMQLLWHVNTGEYLQWNAIIMDRKLYWIGRNWPSPSIKSIDIVTFDLGLILVIVSYSFEQKIAEFHINCQSIQQK